MPGSGTARASLPWSRNRRLRAALVAGVLAGSWRRSPPPLSISADALTLIAPSLIRTGAGGLAWWRVRGSALGDTRAALDLRQAYRLQTLEVRLHERRLEQAIGLCREARIEPLLAKGWAAARLYPDAALRPYGDVDLWVHPSEYAAALAALGSPEGIRCRVDLHAGFPTLDRSWAELYDRSRLVRVGTADVRVLGLEDHLRLLCLHMLGHGVWRPVWLCDVAATAESLPDGFDWDVCLRGPERHAQWIGCAIGLARELLGAGLDARAPRMRLPRWLPAAVLRQWARDVHYMSTPSMAFALRRPGRILAALRLRWPNAVEATVGRGGPFNAMPRLPFQLGECVARTVAFARRLPT